MAGEKPREIAAQILAQRQHGEFVEALLDRALERHTFKPEDRRFLQELVYGAVRWELTLDWLINQKTGGNPQKPLVQNLLRLALYQLFWLERVPSYAVVNETVEIAKSNGLLPQAKFINAILRGYGREAEPTRAMLTDFRSTNLALGFSHPEWLCRKWASRWGREKTVRLLEWNNSPPASFARLNTLKATPETLLNAWPEEKVEAESVSFPWVPNSLVFRLKNAVLGTMPSFQNGLFYVQDPSTFLAVHMLDPQPGETILDVCAAPGGKTTYIAQRMKNQGIVVAEDFDIERLKMVAANASKLGATCVRTDPGLRDGPFDRILVDAPCSNTGVMRRRVELRWRITPEEIHRLSKLQVNILAAATKRLRPGGTLVYSTCSLESEENAAVIREFLNVNPAFKLLEERSLVPFENETDGAYCAKLQAAK